MKSTINLILGSIIGVIILLTFFVFLMLKLNNDVTWVWVFSPLLFYFVVYMIGLFMLIIKMMVLKGKSKRIISSINSRRKKE
jgi:phosphate/sulfate permease